MPLPTMLLCLYLAVGLGFALVFVTLGVGRLDPVARSSTLGFRVLLIPGAVLLWPLLAARWLRGARVPVEATAHKRLATANRPVDSER